MASVRLLYVEDDPLDQELTRRHLERAAPNMTLTVVATVAEACDRLAEADLVLCDYRLPDGTGLDLLEAVKAADRQVPVVLVTGSRDPEAAVRLLKAGAADYVAKRPGYEETLPAVLEGALRWFRSAHEIKRTPVRILYAEAEEADADLARRALAEYSPLLRLDVAPRGAGALDRLRRGRYDLVLLDHRATDLSSIELLKALREERIAVPVVMLTAHGDEDTAVQAFKLGIADYIIKQPGYLARLPYAVEHLLAQRRLADEKDALLVLHGLTGAIATLQDLDSLARTVTRAAADLLKGDLSVLWLVEGDVLSPAGWCGMEAAEARALRLAWRGGSPDVEAILARRGGYAAVWLQGGDRPLGMLAVAGHRLRQAAGDERLLAILADHAAIAIANARLYEQLDAERRVVETLYRIGGVLAAELDIERLLQLLTDEATVLSGAEAGAFFSTEVSRVEGEGDEPSAVSGAPRHLFARPLAARHRALLGPTLREGAVLRLDDATASEGRLPARSYLGVPVVSRSGAVSGALLLAHAAPGAFTERHERLLSAVAAQAAVAIDNARLYEQAQQAIRLRDDFLSVASHELRTPLTSVLVPVQMLLSAARDGPLDRLAPARIVEMLETAVRQSKRFAALVEGLLDVSRIAAGRLEIETEEADLAQVVRAGVANLETEIARSGSAVTVAVEGSTSGRWDRLRLEQVVTNVVSNALKYGAGKPIEVRLTSDGGQARLAVSDQGIGIAAEDQGRIFERFERAVSARRYGGLGMGLYIARQIVEAHGGSIAVESEGPGRGSRFVVTLPHRCPARR